VDIVVGGLLLTVIAIPAVIAFRIDLGAAKTRRRNLEAKIRAENAELGEATMQVLMRKAKRESDAATR
jgi:hypothetical protein